MPLGNQTLQASEVQRAAAFVDVAPVGRVGDDFDVRAQPPE